MIFQTVEQLQTSVAKLTAQNEKMREALDILARLGNGGYYGTSECNMIARAALDALPNIPKRIV